MERGIASTISNFVEQEFARVRLGDRRLDQRLKHLAAALAAAPQESLPKACGAWKDGKAAYRFCSNPSVTRETVMKGHFEATADRIRGLGEVLVVEDTTTLNFSHHPEVEGLGNIGSQAWPNQLQGALVHSALAVEVGTHRVVGLLAQEVILRKEYHARGETREQKLKRPRESRKWLGGAREAWERVGAASSLVFVFDREGDVFEAMEGLRQRAGRFVIRAAWNRRLKSGGDERLYVLDQIRREPVLGTTRLEIPPKGGRKGRVAELSLRAASYTLSPPRKSSGGTPLDVHLVQVREEAPPSEKEGLDWTLLTSEPIGTPQEILRVVEHYRGRWKIEEWHKVLKSGCRIEDRQLESWDRLDVLLGLFSVIAWRLLAIRDEARNEAGTDTVLTPVEKTILRRMDRSLPAEPTVRDYLRAIAKMGGFLARKGDGEPGWQTLWGGMTRLRDLEIGFTLANPSCG